MYFTHGPYVFLPLALAGNMTPIVVCVCALSYRTCLRRITVQHHDVQHVRFIELFIYIYIQYTYCTCWRRRWIWNPWNVGVSKIVTYVCMCIYIYYKYTPQLATLTGKNGNKPWDFSTLEGPNPFIIGRPHEESSAGGSPHWCRLNHRTVLETFKLPELSCSLRACGLAKWERHEWKKTVSLTRNCFAM